MKSLRRIILEITQANGGGVTAAAPAPGSINFGFNPINTNTNNPEGGIVNNNIASPGSNNNLGSPDSIVGSTSGNSSTASPNPTAGSTSGNSSTTSPNPIAGSTSGNSTTSPNPIAGSTFTVSPGASVGVVNYSPNYSPTNTNTNIFYGGGGGGGGGGGLSDPAGRAGRLSSVPGSAAPETAIGLLQRSRLLNAQKELGMLSHQRLIQMLRNNKNK